MVAGNRAGPGQRTLYTAAPGSRGSLSDRQEHRGSGKLRGQEAMGHWIAQMVPWGQTLAKALLLRALGNPMRGGAENGRSPSGRAKAGSGREGGGAKAGRAPSPLQHTISP